MLEQIGDFILTSKFAKFKTQNADFNQFYQTRATVGGEAGNFQGYVKLNTSFIPKE